MTIKFGPLTQHTTTTAASSFAELDAQLKARMAEIVQEAVDNLARRVLTGETPVDAFERLPDGSLRKLDAVLLPHRAES